MQNQSCRPPAPTRRLWNQVIILFILAYGSLVFAPSTQAQDGSGDPVTNVEVTVGSGSSGGTVGSNFAWRDQISTVPVTIECLDKNGQAVPNAAVNISITSPGALSSNSGTTDSNGNVSVTVSSVDISLDSATVTVTASSEGASGNANVSLRGIQVAFSPTLIRMGVYKPATDTATVTPANDATRIGITTTGNSEASVSAAPGNSTSGTILLTLTGQSGSMSKQGDEWLVTDVSGSNKPMAAIVVVIPAAIGTPHPTFPAKAVPPTNVALAGDSSPVPVPAPPAGEVYLATAYLDYMTVQVVDQFNDGLDQLYAGAPVSETVNSVVVSINQSLTSTGTYLDPVGYVPGRDNGPPLVAANSSDALQWTSAVYTYHVAIPKSTVSQNISVSVAGFPLNPAVVDRIVTGQAPNILTISW